MKKIAVLSAALAFLLMLGAKPPMNDDFRKQTVRIMPLGDSITDGFWTNGGYRKYLDYKLTEEGYSGIDFVGPQGSDKASFTYNGKNFEYDNNHAGYSGYTIKDINGGFFGKLNGITETLQKGGYMEKYSPDIVLLQIGTNDVFNGHLDGSEQRLNELIDYILGKMSSSGVIFLSTIPDISTSVGMMDTNMQADVDAFNKIVQGTADKYKSAGKNVVFVDIHSVINPDTDLHDGIHPSEEGYEKIGLYWAAVIDSYLSTNAAQGTTSTTVKTSLCGDANNDSKVNLADTVMIMQALVNPDKFGRVGTDSSHITPQGWANADCSGSGDGVTLNDALAIQKYMLELIDKLPE
ncbi:MAG: GDSL-type esterase/lipase family protein [Ruminococcus sp.]|nr:GDSL-type esterase/lipase family protein [Ruminococcus sp.]